MAALDVAGKNVLITGASAGIGRDLALLLARNGANVALLARRLELLEDLAAECSALNSKVALAVRCDVTERPSCQAAVQKVVEELKQIDIIVLNAGMSMGCYFEDIKDLSDGDKMLSLNVMGVANVLHYAFPFIPKENASRIVVISSVAGVVGVPFRTLYCASKWAVHGFCASLRPELLEAYGDKAPKVVVSCPPEVATGLNTNRLKFGNDVTAQFNEETAVPSTVAAEKILESIREGVRIGLFSRVHQWLHSLYNCFPSYIDKIVIDGVKKSHRAPRYGNMPSKM